MISTRDLSALPTIETLRKLTQSLAMLEAILMRDWEHRYFSFNSKWADGQQMASMCNGQGDGWYCGFDVHGAFLKGFDHECKMSPWTPETSRVWPGVLDGVPEDFNAFVTEPAFSMNDTTFCIWRGVHDSHWNTGEIVYPEGDDPDGSAWMLSILDGNPNTYKAWAEDYYDLSINLSAVAQLYSRTPLSAILVQQLNPKTDLESLSSDASEIDYPVERS